MANITINTNIASLKAQGRLASTTEGLQKSYQRLSSGLRITSASDDAAGLAVADSLRSDQRLASVAIRNGNDGKSLIAIADSALNEIGNVLSRMGELSQQSANGVLSNTQRSALQNEFSALGSEINRIANTTTFNGLNLLSGGAEISFQIGFDSTGDSRISFSGVQATLQNYGLGNAGGALSYSVSTQTAARAALDAVRDAVSSNTTFRGNLGKTDSRLSVAINNLTSLRENYAAAESQIRDVDVASEAANLTRQNILQQAGAAILSQANQQPGLALSLLG